MTISNEKWQLILAQITANDTQLVALGLSRFDLTDEAAIELVTACKTNTTLKKLNLVENQIGEQGLKSLAEMLETNRTLVSLRLSGNQISDNSLRLFIEVFKHNSTLTSLSLYPKKMGESSSFLLGKISEMLDKNKNCPIKSLLNFIEKNDPMITTIDLAMYKNGNDRFHHFQKAYETEFKIALSNNIYIKKLIIDLGNWPALSFCSIASYKYLHEIEIVNTERNTTDKLGPGYCAHFIRELTQALDSNKSLIKIKNLERLFIWDGQKAEAMAINKKLQRNYQQAYKVDQEKIY